MTRIGIHQPAYLPWLGYFNKIKESDIFVFLDSVQFEKNSFINRNKIKTPQGPLWLTIPVKTKGHMSETLASTEIDTSKPWQQKHLRAIELNYRKAAYFDAHYSSLHDALLTSNSLRLSDYLFDHLLFWLKLLDIETPVVRSSELCLEASKSDLVLDICKHFSANEYLSGPFGENYLNQEKFAQSGIAIRYQNFAHPVYKQLWGAFLPNMSVVDYAMNELGA